MPVVLKNPARYPIKVFLLFDKSSLSPAPSPRKTDFPVPVCSIRPATESFAPGVVVPIPTFPALVINRVEVATWVPPLFITTV